MSLNFMIVVDDGGELKSVSAAELPQELQEGIDVELNRVLDARAIATGDYDPSDDDTPFVVGLSSDFAAEG